MWFLLLYDLNPEQLDQCPNTLVHLKTWLYCYIYFKDNAALKRLNNLINLFCKTSVHVLFAHNYFQYILFHQGFFYHIIIRLVELHFQGFYGVALPQMKRQLQLILIYWWLSALTRSLRVNRWFHRIHSLNLRWFDVFVTEFINCSSDEDKPVIVYVSKMCPVEKDLFPENKHG